jgi:hypothetical protein
MEVKSEDLPHVVYVADCPEVAFVHENYATAYKYWRKHHNYKYPLKIAVLGRHCTPEAEIVDVSE